MMNTTEQRHQAVFEDCNNNKQKNPASTSIHHPVLCDSFLAPLFDRQ